MDFCTDNSTGTCSCRKFACDPVAEQCTKYAEALAQSKGLEIIYQSSNIVLCAYDRAWQISFGNVGDLIGYLVANGGDNEQ